MRQARSLAAPLAVLCAAVPACRGSVPSRPRPSTSVVCRVVRVVDGDTIRVVYKGREEPVRLLSINTPEKGEPGFEEATEALRRLVVGDHEEGRDILLKFEKPGVEARDRYGRLLGYIFVNVNVEMVRLGHSPFWTRYGRGRYAHEFERAVQAAEEAPSED